VINWCSPSLDNSEAFIIFAKVIGPFPSLDLSTLSRLFSRSEARIGSYLFSVRYQLHILEIMSSIPQDLECIWRSWSRVEMQQYTSLLVSLAFFLCIELI